MIKKCFFVSICLLFVMFLSDDAHAKSYAWLIAIDGSAHKLDVDANKIIPKIDLKGSPRISVSLQEIDDAVVGDAVSNLLTITNDYGRVGQWVGVYNLKDLSFRKDLGIESYDPKLVLPKILLPPIGNKIYVIWWNRAKAEDFFKGGETYSVYDKTTLNKISDLISFPIDIYKPWSFSSDGKKIHSINLDANEVKIYDSLSLQLLETISIANMWEGKTLFRKGLEYFYNDYALFADDLRVNEADTSDFRYFTYNFITKVQSMKIIVEELGSGILTPDAKKLVLLEYPRTNSKMHIYDFVSGEKIKSLDFSNKYSAVGDLGMTSISPDSSKLYLLGRDKITDSRGLIVIDLKTYAVIAEIPNVEGSRMIFFEN